MEMFLSWFRIFQEINSMYGCTADVGPAGIKKIIPPEAG